MGNIVHPVKTSFTAGEISPRVLAREDYEKYYDGAEVIENFVPMIQGGVIARPGTRFVHEAKDSSVRAQLLNFIFNETQSYVLEFGDQYIRYFSNNGIVVESEVAITGISQATQGVVTTGASHGYQNGEHVILKFILGMVELNNMTVVVSDKTATTFKIKDVDGNYIDTSSYTAYSSEGVACRIYETTTSYAVADVPDVYVAQSADVMYLVHRSYAPYKLSRTGHTNWSLVNPTFSGTVGGGFNAAGEYPGCVTFHEDRLVLGSSNDQTQTLFFSQAADYENFDPGTAQPDEAIEITLSQDKANGIRWLSSGKILSVGTEGGEGIVTSNDDNGAITPDSIKYSPEDTMESAQDRPLKVGNSTLFIQRAKRLVGEFGYNFESDGYISDDVSVLSESILRSKAVEMAYQKEPNKMIYVPRTDGQIATFTYQKRQKVFAWARMILGGTFDGGNAIVESVTVIPGLNEDQVWMSVKRTINGSTRRYIEYLTEFFYADDETDLTDALQMDSAILRDHAEANLAGNNGDFETWALSVPSGWTLDSGAVAQDSVNVKYGSYSAKVTRSTADAALSYSNTDFADYQGKTITFKCYVKCSTASRARIGIEDGVSSGYSSYHTGSGDYELLSVTYQVNSAATELKFTLQVNSGAEEAYFDGAYAIPGETGADLFTNTVTNADHLEGRTVAVFGDGRVLPDATVTNGSITISEGTYKKIAIGEKYTAKVTTLPFVKGNPAGSAQGKLSYLSHAILKVFQTVGGHAGHAEQTDLDEIVYEDYPEVMDTPATLVTDDIKVPVEGGNKRRAQITVEQRQPLPMTILSIMPEYSVNV